MSIYYLQHHGVKGQKWGVRRYQNADGSLTPAGKRRQRSEIKQDERRLYKESYDRFTKEYNLEGKRKAAFDYGKNIILTWMTVEVEVLKPEVST
jgi:hypothetical protein